MAAAATARNLVVAVGYHLRALESDAGGARAPCRQAAQLVTARWMSGTPAPAWWLREVVGGGQVIEQSTHFYDLARHLVGEATVIAAAWTRRSRSSREGADVADATAAVIRFESERSAASRTRAAWPTPWSRSSSLRTGC